MKFSVILQKYSRKLYGTLLNNVVDSTVDLYCTIRNCLNKILFSSMKLKIHCPLRKCDQLLIVSA